ncbi:hypothetical protein ERJ75_001723000 [Trypanosoma vivax]|nr:hypothetical protein ERJ75_001723000 [Trypanosoma vivax]
MTQLALAMACLLAGTLVSTRRGSAAPAAAGANIGAASILCEAALQADQISAKATAMPCEAVKTKLEETLNNVTKAVWDNALKHSGRLGKRTMDMVGNWTGGNTLDEFCRRIGKRTEPRVYSANTALDTCTAKTKEAADKASEAVEPDVTQATDRWWKTNEQTSREEANAKHLCLGATMVYLCTGQVGSNPCFSKGKEPGELAAGNEKAGQIAAKKVAEIWPKAKATLCTAKTTERNIRSTIGRFWAQVRSRTSAGD